MPKQRPCSITVSWRASFRKSHGSSEVYVDSLQLMANPFSFHMGCLLSSERDRTLQVELEGAQVIRGRLEEVLGRSLERLSRLETLAAIGGGELESVRVRHKHAF